MHFPPFATKVCKILPRLIFCTLSEPGQRYELSARGVELWCEIAESQVILKAMWC